MVNESCIAFQTYVAFWLKIEMNVMVFSLVSFLLVFAYDFANAGIEKRKTKKKRERESEMAKWDSVTINAQ